MWKAHQCTGPSWTFDVPSQQLPLGFSTRDSVMVTFEPVLPQAVTTRRIKKKAAEPNPEFIPDVGVAQNSPRPQRGQGRSDLFSKENLRFSPPPTPNQNFAPAPPPMSAGPKSSGPSLSETGPPTAPSHPASPAQPAQPRLRRVSGHASHWAPSSPAGSAQRPRLPKQLSPGWPGPKSSSRPLRRSLRLASGPVPQRAWWRVLRVCDWPQAQVCMKQALPIQQPAQAQLSPARPAQFQAQPAAYSGCPALSPACPAQAPEHASH